MSISMRLAFPAPPVARPQLSVRAASSSLPVARVAAQRREADALRGCASLPLKPLPLGAGQPSCRRRGAAAVCHSSAHLSAHTMQWISAGATAVLLLAKGTAVHKSFLVPFFALQAPSSIISWIKSDYGQWAAFLALLVRLFFFIPGELELPLSTMLLVSVAPYQMMNLRGKGNEEVREREMTSPFSGNHNTASKVGYDAVEPSVARVRASIPDPPVAPHFRRGQTDHTAASVCSASALDSSAPLAMCPSAAWPPQSCEAWRRRLRERRTRRRGLWRRPGGPSNDLAAREWEDAQWFKGWGRGHS
ncbi:hypothetical protein PR202_ga05989 [Eleusine coracana subsp. coracana]|uniref:Uncharacterized protein n=1 Tax=Eleusine coracana subsp. coracana TaxID=191504 RepID=A0AAV5BVK6_ELECO|nr:hypothetical protein PR202_ga05989 [Eleusine coracana subsp. coracana]